MAGHKVLSEPSNGQGARKLPVDAVTPYQSLLGTLSSRSLLSDPPLKKRRIEGKAQRQSFKEASPSSHDRSSSSSEVEEDNLEENGDGNLYDLNEPYALHFTDDEGQNRDGILVDVKSGNWSTQRLPSVESPHNVFKYPKSLEFKHIRYLMNNWSINELCLKKRLNEKAKQRTRLLFGDLRHLSRVIFEYKDVLYPQRTARKAEELRFLACLHSLNHVLKTRDRILRNTARLARDTDGDAEARDQGFTRPKVLILLPTKQMCHHYVSTLLSLYEPDQVENKKRFDETFSLPSDQFSMDKPDDFRDLFAGNDDDMFRLGLKFTRKSMKLYSKFYSSDIIIASPLGLRLALEGNSKTNEDKDFLSSIEIFIVDQAEALQMQNWEHVQIIFESLNLQPKEPHGCDFSRVRNWYLDGNAKYVRQNVVFSSFNFTSLNQLYGSHMQNLAGKLKCCVHEPGMLATLNVVPRQTFSRFTFRNVSSEPDDRFECFCNTVLPPLLKSKTFSQQPLGALLWMTSYADFLRVKNFLDTSLIAQDVSFGAISEYTAVREVARARSHFLTGKHSILLYTERAHHFRRYRIQGVKKVIMYKLPDNPLFYKEVVDGHLGAKPSDANLDSLEANVKVLYSRLDALSLERVVGSDRYMTMLNEKGGDTFSFSN